jgi:hypothetical protein
MMGCFRAVVVMMALALLVAGCAQVSGNAARDRTPSSTTTGSTDGLPDDGPPDLKTEVDRTKTADGVRLTLDWAYADERFAAVSLRTQRLDGPGPAALEPALWDDSVGNEAELPPYVEISDASGQDFDLVGGGTNRERADATFDAPEGLEPGGGHRFRLEVPVQEGPALAGRPEAGPFVFVFKVPVRPAPTIEPNQKAEAEGVTLTLDRVVASPLAPQAVICFEPPDDGHDWMPFLRYDEGPDDGVGSAPQELGDGCWSLAMAAPVEGRSSVTVANLEGMPTGPPDPGQTAINPKTIRGPWTFEFEAPAR